MVELHFVTMPIFWNENEIRKLFVSNRWLIHYEIQYIMQEFLNLYIDVTCCYMGLSAQFVRLFDYKHFSFPYHKPNIICSRNISRCSCVLIWYVLALMMSYFSIVYPMLFCFEQHYPLNVKVNKLSSTKTQLPYDYYFLKYCKPAKIVNSAENLGEVLRGDRIENSVYEVSICTFSLDSLVVSYIQLNW